jgi:FMN reductase
MSQVLLISGSPATHSKSGALLRYAEEKLRQSGLTSTSLSVRDFPAEDLIQARYESPAFESLRAQVAKASGLILATPIYKASYTGSLKALLDILPQNALRGKKVLPLATGGTLAHLLAVDYALRPVLAVLGASDIAQAVYGVDSQFHSLEPELRLEQELQDRVDQALGRFAQEIKTSSDPYAQAA